MPRDDLSDILVSTSKKAPSYIDKVVGKIYITIGLS